MSVERINGRRVVLSVSGGKDSAAASLYLRELGIEHDRVFADTGWEHQKTYEYLRGPLTAALGPITEVRAEKLFTELVREKRIFPDRVKRFCTVFRRRGRSRHGEAECSTEGRAGLFAQADTARFVGSRHSSSELDRGRRGGATQRPRPESIRDRGVVSPGRP